MKKEEKDLEKKMDEEKSLSLGLNFRPMTDRTRNYLHLFFVIAASILFLAVIYRWSEISQGIGKIVNAIMPVIYGLVIAYILNPVVNALDRLFYPRIRIKELRRNARPPKPLRFHHKKLTPDEQRKKARRRVRRCSVFISVLCLLLVAALIVYLVIPEVVTSISGLVENFPKGATDVKGILKKLLFNNEKLLERVEPVVTNGIKMIEDWLQNDFFAKIGDLAGYVATGLSSVFGVIYNLLIGLFVAIYVLMDKEKFQAQARKFVIGCMKEKNSKKLLNVTARAHAIFGKAITGKILDSIIIGVLCFLLLFIFQIPYAALVGVIVGVTNVIPFLGPYIGAVPSALLIIIEDPVKGLYFIIIILVLQQFDCNYLDPKIVGGSIGLSPFWEIFACLLGGGLFGLIGLLLGVPAFALFSVIVKDSLENGLKKKGMPTDTESYYSKQKRKKVPPAEDGGFDGGGHEG